MASPPACLVAGAVAPVQFLKLLKTFNFGSYSTNAIKADTTLDLPDQHTMARRRAGAKLGWMVHALVYLAVNGGLALVAMPPVANRV